MASNSLRKYIEYIQPQLNVPCCTASAVLLSAEIMMTAADKKEYFSRLYLYYLTRKMQNRLGKYGAELKDTLVALSKYGVPPDRYWPFTYNRVNVEPSRQATELAANYRLHSCIVADFAKYKEYLDNNIPIIIGIRTGRKFWSLSGPIETHRYMPIDNVCNLPSTGHAVVIVGYDDELNGGSWIIANSTGPKWGDHGYAAISYACTIDIGESYILTEFAGLSVDKKFQIFDK